MRKSAVVIVAAAAVFTAAATQAPSRPKRFTRIARILAELPNPFEGGLRTVGPQHRTFVIEMVDTSKIRFSLLRYEYDSWKKDPIGPGALNSAALWRVVGVEEKYCASSIRKLLDVNSPEPPQIKMAEPKGSLPPYDRLLPCVVSSQLTPTRR